MRLPHQFQENQLLSLVPDGPLTPEALDALVPDEEPAPEPGDFWIDPDDDDLLDAA